MRTRELIAVLCGVATAAGLSYAFDVEPKTLESLLLVIPALVVTVVVGLALTRREELE
jgi:ABC-type spermidine/putrescine transport system permease subunit II